MGDDIDALIPLILGNFNALKSIEPEKIGDVRLKLIAFHLVDIF